MDQVRQGEIALLLVKHLIRKRGIMVSRDNMRDLGNTAKAIGVSLDELKQFAKPIIQELLDECFIFKG
jgi:hypothetical protein